MFLFAQFRFLVQRDQPLSPLLFDHMTMMLDASTVTHECCCFALLILNAFLCFRQWRYVSELIRQESARDDYHLMQDADNKRVSQILRPVRSSRPRSPSSPVGSPFRETDAQEARQTLRRADRGKEGQRTNESHDAGMVCRSLQTQMWRRKENSDSPASCSNLVTSPRRVVKSSSHAAQSESDLNDSHSPALASQSSPVSVENVYIEDQVEEDQVESGNREEELISLVRRIHHDGKARIFPLRPSQDSTLSHNLNNAARENLLAGVSSRSEQWLPFHSNSSSFNSNLSLRGTSGPSKRVSSGSRYTAQLLRRRSRSDT